MKIGKHPIHVLLPHTAWAMLLLVPVTFLGFYPTYYSNFKAPWIIHLHGGLMALWLGMVILQPWLIKTNQFRWHRLTGKLSYALMPFIIITGFLLLRYGYQRVLGGDTVAPADYYPEGATAAGKAADFVVIGSVYLCWLLTYYVLGIINRKNTTAHATFMLAASLTILGPAGDRLLDHFCEAMGWTFNALAENATFGVVMILFCVLLIYQYKKQLPVWPSVAVLAIQSIGIVLYHWLPFHDVWDSLAAFLFSTS